MEWGAARSVRNRRPLTCPDVVCAGHRRRYASPLPCPARRLPWVLGPTYCPQVSHPPCGARGDGIEEGDVLGSHPFLCTTPQRMEAYYALNPNPNVDMALLVSTLIPVFWNALHPHAPP